MTNRKNIKFNKAPFVVNIHNSFQPFGWDGSLVVGSNASMTYKGKTGRVSIDLLVTNVSSETEAVGKIIKIRTVNGNDDYYSFGEEIDKFEELAIGQEVCFLMEHVECFG